MNSNSTKPITIPFELFVQLLFNNKESFLEDSDAYMREKMPVSPAMAGLLMAWDKEQQFVVVLAPRSEFNEKHYHVAYTREAWKSSSVYFAKIKAAQEFSQQQIMLREEKIKELSKKLEQDIGFDAEYATGMAKMIIFKRDITMAKLYGVDISMLSEDVTKKTKMI